MRVLVTGGAGYIGSVVTEELVADGHAVVVYDSLYKGHRGAIGAGAEFVQADLTDGETKLAFEHALRWYERAYGIRYASLRYFNAAGATAHCGEWHDPETHLIPLLLQVAAGTRPSVEIYGDDYPTRDGTCVRDYIHVVDLARAHIRALDRLDARSALYNLGCGGDGYTVKEVLDVARAVTGREIPVRVGARRAGDPA